MNNSKLFKNAEGLTEEDHINSYYNSNYSQFENNLEILKLKVDEDFYYQENALTELIQLMDQQKDAYLRDMDLIEEEYNKISDATKKVVPKIEECNNKVQECRKIEQHFETFVGNVKALESQLSIRKK